MIAFFASGFHSRDYDPQQHRAATYPGDVWLHNPWGHDGKPMDPDQWFRREADGWEAALNYIAWERFTQNRRAKGLRTFIHTGNPHLVSHNLWPRYESWLRWAASIYDGVSFDSSEDVVNDTDEFRLIASLPCEVIIEASPLASHRHLHRFSRAMSQAFFNDIDRPVERWAKKVGGETYILLAHIDSRSRAQALAEEAESLCFVPVMPVKFMGAS